MDILGIQLDLILFVIVPIITILSSIAIWVAYTLNKYKAFILPGAWRRIQVEIFERRGDNPWGHRRVTKACKIKRDERNFWILKDTGEWLVAPPLEFVMFQGLAKYYMPERGVYIPIVPVMDNQALTWRGYLNEREKEAALSRLKANRDAFEKRNILLQYAPVILSVIVIAMILVFILVVGGSMNNVAEQFKIAANSLSQAAGTCTPGGAAPAAPIAQPPV